MTAATAGTYKVPEATLQLQQLAVRWLRHVGLDDAATALHTLELEDKAEVHDLISDIDVDLDEMLWDLMDDLMNADSDTELIAAIRDHALWTMHLAGVTTLLARTGWLTVPDLNVPVSTVKPIPCADRCGFAAALHDLLAAVAAVALRRAAMVRDIQGLILGPQSPPHQLAALMLTARDLSRADDHD